MKVAPQKKSDWELIQAIKAGETALFQELVTRYQQQVAATVVGMLGNNPVAEDVGQEVFIRFFKAIDQFKGESALGTYLTRIAMNLSLNEIKRQKRRKAFSLFSREESDRVLEVPDHGMTQEQRNTQLMVQQGLQQLPEDFRSVLVLRLLEGFSTRETAEMLGIPIGTVLSRLARGQQRLKEILSTL